MLIQICTSDFLIELSEHQQELLSGGQDFELCNTNFAQRTINAEGIGTSTPSGNTAANSNVQKKEVNNSAQDFFSLDLTNPLSITSLGNTSNS